MMNGKQKIAEQSRIWLWESFIKLLEKEDYGKITITQIAENADLTRKTFYNSFKSKDDLLNYKCKKLVDAFIEKLATIPFEQRTIEKSLNVFIDYWWSERSIIILIKKRGLYQRFVEMWLDQIEERYLEYQTSWKSDNQIENKYQMAFILGGLSNMLSLWFDAESPIPPIQMKKLIKNIITKQFKKASF